MCVNKIWIANPHSAGMGQMWDSVGNSMENSSKQKAYFFLDPHPEGSRNPNFVDRISDEPLDFAHRCLLVPSFLCLLCCRPASLLSCGGALPDHLEDSCFFMCCHWNFESNKAKTFRRHFCLKHSKTG